MGVNMILKLFLPIVISLIIYPVGTFINVQLFGYNYDIGLTIATRTSATTAVTTFEVTNYHKDTLFVGEPNIEARRADTGEYLSQVSCLDGFQVQLGKDETGKGSVCWNDDESLRNTKIIVIYNHSIFVNKTAMWEF